MDMTEVVSTENEVIMEDNKNAFEGSAKTARTLKNIKSLVAKTLKEDYGIDDENKVEALLKTHGLSASQFDFVSAAENALNTQVLNDVSVDANANKCEKTIESMMVEASNPIKKAIGYDMLYRQLKQDYGKAEAKRLTAEMYTYALALADSTKILSCYCYSIDASAIVKRGRDFGQLHSAPSKRLCSYISCLCETIHQMSNHLAGAIAIGTFFMDAAHVLMYTDNNGSGYTIEQIRTDKDIRKMIENEFQQFVHSVNHLSRNASESPFSNVSVFDKPKLLTLLGDANMKEYFKDETEDFKSQNKENWIDYVADYIMELQKIFIDFFDKGDKLSNGMPYRFPVVTVNLSKSENGDTPILDEEFFDYLTHKDIYRYNIFSSCGTKIASCCFRGDTPILARNSERGEFLTTMKDLNESIVCNTNTEIFSNGFWKQYSKVIVPYTDPWIKVTTSNSKEFVCTNNHIVPTLRGDVRADELTKDDYILFTTKSANVTDYHEDYSYNVGVLIGAFLGDGSYGTCRDGIERSINLSLNPYKLGALETYINKAVNELSKFGSDEDKDSAETITHVRIKDKNVSLVINSAKIAQLMINFVPHNVAQNKYFNERLLGCSKEFKLGMIYGLMHTGGGNSNRYYTTSKRLVTQIEALYTTMGIPSNIDVDTRVGPVLFKGVEYNSDYPVYCIRSYSDTNKSSAKDVCVWRNNSIYFKISNIETVENTDGTAYCVNMKDQDNPYFTLPNGIITHNCRLINDIDLMTEYGSQSNSFGGTGISLGSHRVVTIDFNRIALEANSYKEYFDILDRRIEDSAKILASHKRLLQLLTDKGLQLFIQNGWIRMDRLFSTFGVLGLTETEITVKNKRWEDMPDGTDIIKNSLVELNNKMFEVSSKYGIMGNIEQIPAESMAVRLAKTDRLLFGEDKVPYKLYANQFVPLWKEASIWEKLSTDGKYNKLITGGGIVHAQIGEKVTPNQAKKIIKYAIDCGCEHFALNAVYTKCNNGHASFGNKNVCPVCGSQELHHFTRVVGFFTEVENWNPVRRDWEFPRRTFITLPTDNDNTNKIDDDVSLSQKPLKSETPMAATSTTLLSLSKDDPNPTYYFFYRSSCPHCHDMAHFLTDEAYSKIPGKAIRVDNTDTENIELAKAFDVEETPTLVITDSKGNAKIDSKLDDKGFGIPFAFKALLSGKDSEYINELISLTSDEDLVGSESSDCVDCHF